MNLLQKSLYDKYNYDISVIIPTYRPQEYLEKCFISLSKQSFEGTFEILVVLNGEREPYYNQIKLLVDKIIEPIPIRLIYTKEKGVSKARNLAIESAKGKYLVFLDDDDYVSNVYLHKLFEKIINAQSANIIQSNFKADINGQISDDYISLAYKKLNSSKFSVFKFRKFLSSVCGKIYTREVIGNVRFKENLRISEDSVFLFEMSKNIRGIEFADQDCIYYRNVRSGSALRSHRSVATIIKNYVKKFSNYSSIYFSEPFKYNFWLYISRLAAISKVLVFEIRYSIFHSR